MATHISPDITLPMVGQSPQRQNSDAGNTTNRLAEAVADFASQQLPQTSSPFFRPRKTNTLFFDKKNRELNSAKIIFQTMLKVEPELSKVMKNSPFLSYDHKKALQTFRNINASSKGAHEGLVIIFRRKYVGPQSQVAEKHKWHRLTFDPKTKAFSHFLDELNKCAERVFIPLAQQLIDCLYY